MNQETKTILTILIILALCFTILNQYIGYTNKIRLLRNPCSLCNEIYNPSPILKDNFTYTGLYYNIDDPSKVYYKEDNSTKFIPINYSI